MKKKSEAKEGRKMNVRWTIDEKERQPKLAILVQAEEEVGKLICGGKTKTSEYELAMAEYKKAVLEDAIVNKKNIDRLMDSTNGWGYSNEEIKRYQEGKSTP